jgi:hypothetical protein
MGVGDFMIDRAKTFILANALVIMAVLAALLAVQTIRIDGLRIDLPLIGAIGLVGLKAENETLRGQIKALKAEKAAAARVKAQTEAANTRATEKAEEDAKRFAETDRADADRYIAANRVQRRPRVSASASASDSAGVPAAGSEVSFVDDELPEGLVAVSEADILTCTVNTRILILARQWALEIEANHAPIEQPER